MEMMNFLIRDERNITENLPKVGTRIAGKKGKDPTIKIKLGKRKRTSSDDVSADEKDSDAEFEQMLKEVEEPSKVVEESS